ncbi:MAG TPA: Fic family protein [Nitrosomonas europaea]|uniref:Fic family protein n=1 Tax=Nitrosomonas europaea TaxID=915 RepID=UPI0024936DDD|nr:Fic family protein [Nitrosomonas europaea]HRO57231.1 Fic family protein [Nitrosomonas europaea]HUM74851.1 Fic family protein [Nitrosomonas europaea]
MQEPRILITQELLKLIAEIDEFKGKWEVLKNLSLERLHQLRKVATIESIGSSTRIEGAKLTDMQVETLLSNLSSMSFKTRDEQEVAGYAEAMDIVFQAYEDMTITENHIRQLHQTLLRHSNKDERHRGEYKKIDNHVVAIDEHGKEIGVVFETATPFDTPRKMEELVLWVNKAITENSFHPLLIVAVFVVVFLAIHPFQDGNGRLSRILTTLMLLRAGYSYVPYASLESVVEDNKDLYYKALRRTQTTLKTDSPDWEPWLGFFLRCLKKQKANLAAKIEKEKAADDTILPALAVQILELLKKHERLSIAEMVEHTGANRNTLKVRLRELVSTGRIQRHGKARATWYVLNRK